MAMVDRMSPEMRGVVHHYGLMVVLACTQAGVKQPRHVRHIVETVLSELSPTRRPSSTQGPRSAI
jgi:hypothetical protein